MAHKNYVHVRCADGNIVAVSNLLLEAYKWFVQWNGQEYVSEYSGYFWTDYSKETPDSFFISK